MAIDLTSTKPAKMRAKSSLWQREFSFNIGKKGKVSGKSRMFFTERLALLLETGNALLQSLDAIQKQMDDAVLADIIKDLAKNVEAGRSFSQALSRHPEMFSSTYVNLVGASEHGGFMHQVLKQLLVMEEKRERLRSTLQAALTYPAFLVVFSSSVVIFILVVIFPKFAELFTSIRDHLPFTTIILMYMSDILRQYWHLIIISIAGVFMGISKWLHSPGGNETMDNFKLKTPFLKDIIIEIYLIQVLRILGLSLSNGVSVLDALKSCRDVINNSVFKRFMTGIERQIAEGKGIASGFEKSRMIPPMVQQMIRTGEDSGNLALVMERVADFYEREIEKKLTMISKITEPVMLLVMGVIVGLMVSSIILPIFKLSTIAR